MAQNLVVSHKPSWLYKSLQIDRTLNAHRLLDAAGGLYIEAGIHIPDAEITAAPRIGVGGDEIAKTVLWRWVCQPKEG